MRMCRWTVSECLSEWDCVLGRWRSLFLSWRMQFCGAAIDALVIENMRCLVFWNMRTQSREHQRLGWKAIKVFCSLYLLYAARRSGNLLLQLLMNVSGFGRVFYQADELVLLIDVCQFSRSFNLASYDLVEIQMSFNVYVWYCWKLAFVVAKSLPDCYHNFWFMSVRVCVSMPTCIWMVRVEKINF